MDGTQTEGDTKMDWHHVMTATEIEAHWARVAKLDFAFADRCRKFWESRDVGQLEALKFQAWNCNDREGFALAAAHLAKLAA